MLKFASEHRLRPGRAISLLIDDDARAAGLVAVARLLFASYALLTVWLAPTQPADYAAHALSLLLTYAAFAVLAVPLAIAPRTTSSTPIVHLGVDLGFAVAVTALTNGPSSPLFPLLLFGPLSAACRWGALGTLAASGVAAAAVLAETVAVGDRTPLSLGLLYGDFDVAAAMTRGAYIVAAGAFLAVIAEAEKARRQDAAAIASIVNRAGSPAGLEGAVESTLGVMLGAFGARRAVLAMKHVTADRVFLWDAVLANDSGSPIVSSSELVGSERDSYFFDAPGTSWHASRFRSSDWFDLLAFDADGNRLPTRAFTLPSSLLAIYRCETAMGTSIAFGHEWVGRLLLIDPETGMDRQTALTRARRFAAEIGAAANQEYLLGLLGTRAANIERARLARELHDGVVQTLIVVQMELEVARCRSIKEAPQFADGLSRLQTIVRDETVNLRQLTHRLKNPDASARPLAGLVDLVSRFERETGIAARFYADSGLSVSPRSSDQVTRILQEGLTNVRKHSGARHVLVRAGARDGRLTLSIEDDGRGFGFTGRLSQSEMAASQCGPAVIIERVRELGGEITVESRVGRGARVEVAVPL
jgi:signal transduction histidine kinase